MTTFLGLPTAPPGVGHLRQDEPFPDAARRALADPRLRANLRRATTTIRAKRAAVVSELPDWEQLREAGAAIKDEALRHLDRYLEQLEQQVLARGGTVHWARDANEANALVAELVTAAGADEVVKVKSMLTDEIGLNDALLSAGITAHETDLAELILQLDRDRPSHILVPAIHRNRSEIRDIFLAAMPGVRPGLSDDPAELAEAARLYLRAKFLHARVGVSGANFAVAETGTLCVVESEGNGRMCLTLPDTLITVMGIEKVIPAWADLGVMLQLLPRSATGERMNPYTSMWAGVTPGDGPRRFHLVLVDNGRTAALADSVGREALRCIRCSACLNVCPVYERAGGHAYGSVYPGPIGAVLSPQLTGIEDNASLPYASSLCGACFDVCPVRIDIPSLLVHLRARHVTESRRPGRPPGGEALVMSAVAWVFRSPRRYAAAQRLAALGRLASRGGRIRRLPPPLSAWTDSRDAPVPPRHSFRQWWASEHGGGPPGRTRAGGDPARHGQAAGRASRAGGREASVGDRAAAVGGRAATGRVAESSGSAAGGGQEPGSGTARDEVLARIRRALSLGSSAGGSGVPGAAVTGSGGAAAYRERGELDDAARVDLLAERLADYKAEVRRCGQAGLAEEIARALADRGARRLVVPPGLELPLPSGVQAVAGTGLTAAELDQCDGVLTGVAVAIAETGTLVLDGSPGQGERSASLVPDYHLCVVFADQVVELVPEALARLRPDRPLTLISGPSATSDIELNRVEGVHGPRTLAVIIVDRDT